MKKVCCILVLVLLLSSCQTLFDPDNDIDWTGVTDPETIESIKLFTLEIIQLKAELEAAEREQDFERKLKVVDKIVDLIEWYANIRDVDIEVTAN